MIRHAVKLIALLFYCAGLVSCDHLKQHFSQAAAADSINHSMETSLAIKTENVDYTGDGITMKGFAAYNDSLKGPLPVVIVVHEWWGQTDYPRMRAKQLAELGYFAFAVDMYGDGKTAETPEEAQKLSAPFYGSMKLATPRFEAALAKLSSFPKADTSRIAAIGYCFGGGMVLNMARTGELLKGVVSFHGDLMGTPADKKLLKAKILVCHGEADKFVGADQVAAFKKQMDSVGAKYIFKSYPNATHAFTNPGATEKGKKYNMPIEYNPAADSASWNEMKLFLKDVLR